MICGGGGGGNGPRLRAADFLPQFTWCCDGAYYRGARACSCWTPIYDMEQQEPDLTARVTTRSSTCNDCAYRPDSAEMKEDPYQLVGIDVFWCHKGMRRPKEWRHKDGRVRPGYPADYQPRFANRPDVREERVPYKANGRPALRCGGWAEVNRAEQIERSVLAEMNAEMAADMIAIGGRRLAEDMDLL